MAILRLNVPGAKLTEAVVENLVEALRPMALAGLLANVETVRARAQEQGKDGSNTYQQSVLEEMEAQIALGGKVSWFIDSITEANGIEHRRSQYSSAPLPAQLADFTSAVVTVTISAPHDYGPEREIKLHADQWGCRAENSMPTGEIIQTRDVVERILNDAVDASLLEGQMRPFKIFIGHGADSQWKVLQRLLKDSHNFIVEAFESEERAGYGTLSVVEQMVKSSSVAIVVLTGEDQMSDGSKRARENVIHELGFCQGALGIDRTIILLENGVSEPSNIAGLTQIRFPKGSLIDVEDKIVAALNLRKQADDYSQAGRSYA